MWQFWKNTPVFFIPKLTKKKLFRYPCSADFRKPIEAMVAVSCWVYQFRFTAVLNFGMMLNRSYIIFNSLFRYSGANSCQHQTKRRLLKQKNLIGRKESYFSKREQKQTRDQGHYKHEPDIFHLLKPFLLYLESIFKNFLLFFPQRNKHGLWFIWRYKLQINFNDAFFALLSRTYLQLSTWRAILRKLKTPLELDFECEENFHQMRIKFKDEPKI